MFKISSILAFILMFISQGVSALGLLTPYASVTVISDDNLYRIDSSSNLSLAGFSKEDTLTIATAGIKGVWELSRQRFLLDVSGHNNQFEKNSNLNYLGQEVNSKWNWVVGNSVSGSLSYIHKTTLNDFSNTGSQNSSKKTDQRASVTVDWQASADWRLGASLADAALDYDLINLQASDRRSVTKSFYLKYLPSTGSSVGLTFRQEDGSYPGRDVNEFSIADNRFQQNSMLLNMSWNFSAKSKLAVDLGWNGRTHPTVPKNDYSGVNTELSYAWMPLNKLSFNLKLYQRLESSSYDVSGFRESTGGRLNSNWSVSEKVAINSVISHELKDYIGTDSRFKEYYDKAAFGVVYRPDTTMNVSLQLNRDARSSSQLLRDYESQSLMMQLGVKF